ncbi:hypothetical protein PsorP6_006776 [Peronosclerospora sorghi]|uniref:Uncharacterized protein n=1 Tax=Peronosclerospora sorghi TaxID=230839 RepID=A0ACC0W2V0_9STRA|nr:hypothetical protein PsorP6_006776 [Peronosclerospora sorghi]
MYVYIVLSLLALLTSATAVLSCHLDSFQDASHNFAHKIHFWAHLIGVPERKAPLGQLIPTRAIKRTEQILIQIRESKEHSFMRDNTEARCQIPVPKAHQALACTNTANSLLRQCLRRVRHTSAGIWSFPLSDYKLPPTCPTTRARKPASMTHASGGTRAPARSYETIAGSGASFCNMSVPTSTGDGRHHMVHTQPLALLYGRFCAEDRLCTCISATLASGRVVFRSQCNSIVCRLLVRWYTHSSSHHVRA